MNERKIKNQIIFGNIYKTVLIITIDNKLSKHYGLHITFWCESAKKIHIVITEGEFGLVSLNS